MGKRVIRIFIWSAIILSALVFLFSYGDLFIQNDNGGKKEEPLIPGEKEVTETTEVTDTAEAPGENGKEAEKPSKPSSEVTKTPEAEPQEPAKELRFSEKEMLEEIVRIKTGKKIVVFTFDAGAGKQSLDSILKTLKKHGVKATFFVTGSFAEKNGEDIRRIAAEGHEVFNHTDTHPNLTKITDEKIIAELESAEQKISMLTGKTTKPFFRPPYGARDERVRRVCASAGYRCVYWTVDALDWKEDQGITDAEVKTRILKNLSPGAIYLMHIGDNITGRVLDEVLTEIKRQGYGILSLSQAMLSL